jgi:hypothetical protein
MGGIIISWLEGALSVWRKTIGAHGTGTLRGAGSVKNSVTSLHRASYRS